MKKILVVNVNWVGDVIFSSPIFKALRNVYPDAKISCLAPPRVKNILECIKGIDEIIVYDEDKIHRSLFAKLKLIFQLRKMKFDAAFLLHRSLTRALIVYLAGIPNRIGYNTKNRGCFLTHKIDNLDVNNIHRSDYYLNVVESFGVKVKERTTSIIADENDVIYVKEMLGSFGICIDDYLIVLNCGGNWDLKRWPKEHFTQLIEKLTEKYKQQKVKLIVSGAPKDVCLAEEIIKPLKEKPVILAGKTNLKQLIALMSIADLVVSADSGPLHIANSAGTDIIAIYGPTRPEITGPRGTGNVVILQNDVGCNARACYKLDCKDNVCMKSVTIEDVFNIIWDRHLLHRKISKGVCPKL